MVKFTVEEVRRIMDRPQNIRNISVIAHVDHGKSTLSDSLVARAGIISEKVAGKARILDQREDEIERGITIKSTGVSMYYRHTLFGNQEEYLINLIDSPGHVDFSSEVTAALRVTDGALVVVDAVEGVCVQTETVLRQAIQEKIRPVLMINKVDRAIHELQLTPEEIYQRFVKVIDDVNVVVSSYQHENEEDLTLDPVKGNVVFGAGKDQWAFSLSTFAQRYNKFDEAAKSFISRIWGDNFYDEENKKWSKESTNEKGEQLKRGFVRFVMEPICRLTRAIAKQEKEEYEVLIEKLKITLNQEERKLVGKELGKVVMSRWIPAADCLLQTIICHLPSPATAQQYRAPYLYQGPQDDILNAMAQCDPKGPLCVYISKMIPIEGGRFAAFGRIFSGTIRSGERVRILGSNYKAGSKTDLFQKNIGQVGVFMMGKNPELLGDVPCGNTVAITGIDDYLLKTGTITALTPGDSYPIRSMKYSVAAVFRVAVKAKNPADLPKLQKGLTKLAKSDPLLKVDLQETGEIILAGSGELHIEICVNDLRAFSQCEIIVSPPIVTYKETITQVVEEPLLTKSANKHNRIFGTASPLPKELVSAIQSAEIDPNGDPKLRAEKLVKEYEWDKTDAMKIWCFGPENLGANLLVDMVKGAQYVNEIKDSVCTAFQYASKSGILAEENTQGCRFNLVDAKIHPDAVHRNGAQIMPAARRLFQGLELAANPTLLEPIFLCEITAPNAALGGVYYTLSQKRGEIIQETKLEGSPLHVVKAYLPVAQSFGFASILRANTQGMAFPQNFFDHWEMISGLPYQDNKAAELVLNIRRRKGMKEELPVLEHYVDKL